MANQPLALSQFTSLKDRKRALLSLNDIENLGQELGRGAYGRVYKVRYRGLICAAKEIHSIFVELTDAKRQRNSFVAECTNCSLLKHSNIVDFVGVYYPSQNAFPVMVMELMDQSLTVYVKTPLISLKKKVSILVDVTEGLKYLHNNQPPLIHRDLSPNNILLKFTGMKNEPPTAKIADLGVAKVVQADSKTTRSQLTKAPGTVDFMPPEALTDNPEYGLSLDVFSYGGIMLHTVNQEWPTPKSPTKFDPVTRQTKGLSEVERRKGHLDKLPVSGAAVVLRALIEDCLDNDPDMRPPIGNISESIKPLKDFVKHCNPPLLPPKDFPVLPQIPPHRCATLKSGYPKDRKTNYITDDSLTLFPWYRGNLSRMEAEHALSREATDGCFIVRDPSNVVEKDLGFYTLSLWIKEKTRHLRLRCRSDKKYAVGEFKDGEKSFDSIVELIKHHKKSALLLKSGGTTVLTCIPRS